MFKFIKFIKRNLLLFMLSGMVLGIVIFPVWSHIDQGYDIVSTNSRVDNIYDEVENLKLSGDDLLVGASGFFAQNASVQLNLEVLGTYASTSGNLSFNGEIMPDGATCAADEILKRTGANNWDCAADAGGGIKTEASSVQNLAAATILNFEDVHFSLTASGTTETIVRLDWDSGGPASLSQAETITGNWVNTASPWADNEVIDAISVISGIIGANSISGTQTTTALLTLGDNGDDIVISASDWDVDANGFAIFVQASTTASFEAITYASASAFRGSAFSGGDCDGATQKLTWDTTNGTFGCATDDDIPDAADYTNLTGGTGIGHAVTGTLTFDSTEVEATTWGGGGNATNIWTFNLSAGDPTMTWTRSGASLSLNFETIGYASASKYFGIALSGMAGTDGCSAAGDTLNYTFSTGLFSCGTDGGGGVTSDSLNFDEFQNPLVLDVNVTVSSTSTGYTWNWQSTDVIIGSGSWDFGGADSLEIPTAANPTIDKLGEIGGQVPSASEGNFFRIHDGTAERTISTRTCFGISYPNPTARDHVSIWNAYNPFTINNVYMIASGSNAAGWQIRHSMTNSSFTNLFVANKAASGAAQKTYVTADFNDATLTDGERVDFVITSASAIIDNIFVRVCGFYDS